jgi:hypothetical protein
MTAQEFLEAKGMNLESTALLTMMDGFMRQPDLCMIMEQYARYKIKELDMKIDSVNFIDDLI